MTTAERETPIFRATQMPATLAERGSCALAITVEGIARGDVLFWAGFRLTPGRRAKLSLPGLGLIDCTIMWSEDWRGGATFDTPLHPAVLDHLVELYPADQGRQAP